MSEKERKKDKKRKRQSEAGDYVSTPSKTRVVDGSSSLIKVQHLQADHQRGPLIGASAGLAVPKNTKFKAFSRPRGESTKAGSDELLLHSSNHPRIDYTARENQNVGAEAVLKHYVGVFDPVTKQLQVVEARKMAVRSTLRSEEQQAREEHAAEIANVALANSGSARAKRHDLGMTFGTKKAKKAINALTENAIVPQTAGGEDMGQEEVRKAIKADPAMAAIMESMAPAASTAPTQASLQAAMDENKPRPKANEKAEHPKDVYPISTLVGVETMKEVKVRPWVEASEAGQAIESTSRFVSFRVEGLLQNDDIPKLKVLRYMLVLIKFYQALLAGGKAGGRKLPMRDKLASAMGDESFLLETVKRRFTDGPYVRNSMIVIGVLLTGHRTMSKWHVDNLITHLCALSLIVDNFTTDTHDLREDLGLTPSV